MPEFSELTGTIWRVTENCCLHEDLIFKKFWVQNRYPRSQVAFGNVGEDISALQLEWILLIAWLPKIITGIEFIGHYLADLELFRKTRNESIKGLFLSNQHGRGKGCGSAKREAALPAPWELELAFRGGHRVSLAEGFAGWGKISMYSTGFLSAISWLMILRIKWGIALSQQSISALNHPELGTSMQISSPLLASGAFWLHQPRVCPPVLSLCIFLLSTGILGAVKGWGK